MKPIIFTILLVFAFLFGCTGTDNTTYNKLDNLTNKPEAKISHEGDWTIVTTTEKGNRVYWFLAPDVKNVSPAQFKKTIKSGNKSEGETEIVSQCDAPKQACDDLMKQFNSLSEKYK